MLAKSDQYFVNITKSQCRYFFLRTHSITKYFAWEQLNTNTYINLSKCKFINFTSLLIIAWIKTLVGLKISPFFYQFFIKKRWNFESNQCFDSKFHLFFINFSLETEKLKMWFFNFAVNIVDTSWSFSGLSTLIFFKKHFQRERERERERDVWLLFHWKSHCTCFVVSFFFSWKLLSYIKNFQSLLWLQMLIN